MTSRDAAGVEVLGQRVEDGLFEAGGVVLAEVGEELGLGGLEEGEEVLGDEGELAVEVLGVALGPASLGEEVVLDGVLEV